MGQDAVYFYNYQQDITNGTPCHLEKSDLSLADDGRGQMTDAFECGIGNGEVGMRNAENRGRHWEVRLKSQC